MKNSEEVIGEYSIGWKITGMVIAVILSAINGYLIYTETIDYKHSVMDMLMMIIITSFSIFLLSQATLTVRYKVSMQKDRIKTRGLISNKELLFSDIEGYSEKPYYTKYADMLRLIPKNKKKRNINIPVYILSFSKIHSTVKNNLKNLDEIERKKEEKEIFSSKEFLGKNEEDRKKIIRKYSKFIKTLSVILIVFVIFLMAGTADKDSHIWVFLISVPLICLIIAKASKGTVVLEDRKSEWRPTLGTTFVIYSGIFALKVTGFRLLEYKNILYVAIFLALILSLITWNITKKSIKNKSTIALLLLSILAYSYGLAVCANCLYDSSKNDVHFMKIVSADVSKSLKTTDSDNYYLNIEPEESINITRIKLSSSQYYSNVEREELKLTVKQGNLGSKWYYVN